MTNTKANKIEEIAKQRVKEMTDAELLKQWELTETIFNEYIPVVRGWLMDEIESRHPEAFNRWLDGDAEDKELKDYINGAK
jgi:predicted Ser/Thr protein kinase